MPGISQRPPGPDLSSTHAEQWFLDRGSDQDEFLDYTVPACQADYWC